MNWTVESRRGDGLITDVLDLERASCDVTIRIKLRVGELEERGTRVGRSRKTRGQE